MDDLKTRDYDKAKEFIRQNKHIVDAYNSIIGAYNEQLAIIKDFEREIRGIVDSIEDDFDVATRVSTRCLTVLKKVFGTGPILLSDVLYEFLTPDRFSNNRLLRALKWKGAGIKTAREICELIVPHASGVLDEDFEELKNSRSI